MAPARIIIVGGGFAGVKAARTLRKRLRDQAEVTLFNRENHMVFHPLLAEVVGASVNADAIAAPLRQTLPKVRCRTEDVTRVFPDERSIEYEGHDGRSERLAYDHLILACGSVVNLGMVPGMADHAFPLKTVGDAVALRSHVMQQLEKAEVCDDPDRRRRYLSFIVVGGGYSGVEAAGEINDLARSTRRYFPNISADEIEVRIIHSRDQLLPEIGEKLRAFTKEKMEKAGIDVILEARVMQAFQEGVELKDGRRLNAGTIVCTIGTSPSAVIQRLEVEKERGRLLTETDMRLRGREDIWAVGDCALVENAVDGKPSPPTGQFAERQGRQVAENIARQLRGEALKPFSFKPVGQLCAIGGHKAVAEIFGMRLSGFIAWALWRSVYLMKLPSWSRRVKVGFDWFWQLIFSRDLTHLKTDRTSRVSKAFYRAGDVVFSEGDPGHDFYVIETGEAEVRRGAGEAQALLATLGPGDFFGEMALIDQAPRNAAVVAKSDLEVVVMGREVFNQVSGALAPLREVLAEAVERRKQS